MGVFQNFDIESFKLLLENYYTLPMILILLIYLGVVAWIDQKTKKIPNKLNFFFFFLRILLIPLVGIGLENIMGLVVGFLILLIPAMIANQPMGGDIKLAAILGFYLGPVLILFSIASTFLLLYISMYFLFSKKEGKLLAVGPFFLITHIIFISLMFLL